MRETAVESHPFRRVREKAWVCGVPLIAKNAMSGAPAKWRLKSETQAPFEFEYATRQPG
jgi:hypothetical protein